MVSFILLRFHWRYSHKRVCILISCIPVWLFAFFVIGLCLSWGRPPLCLSTRCSAPAPPACRCCGKLCREAFSCSSSVSSSSIQTTARVHVSADTRRSPLSVEAVECFWVSSSQAVALCAHHLPDMSRSILGQPPSPGCAAAPGLVLPGCRVPGPVGGERSPRCLYSGRPTLSTLSILL